MLVPMKSSKLVDPWPIECDFLRVAKMASHAIFQYNVLVIDIDNTTLEPKSLRMVILTIILVQVLCCIYQSPKHYIEIWHDRPFSLHHATFSFDLYNSRYMLYMLWFYFRVRILSPLRPLCKYLTISNGPYKYVVTIFIKYWNVMQCNSWQDSVFMIINSGSPHGCLSY